MVKATLRLPDPLLEELRERSQQEGRSLNAVAVHTLWRGLGKDPVDKELSAVLGSFIAEPATAVYQSADVEKAVAGLSENTRHLTDALDWTRGSH